MISVYHKEKAENLKQALESIWDNQTLRPSEIVLVKDGLLNQELDELIDDFSRKAPLKILSLKENLGLGKALALGLQECSNEIIARMDSDDISFPGRFEKQIDFFKTNPDVSVLGGQVSEFQGDTSNVVGHRKVPKTHLQIIKFAKKRSPFNHPAVVFKKSVVLSVGNYQDFKFMEDYHLWLRIIGKGHICANLADEILYFRMSDDVIGRRHGWFYFKQECRLSLLAKDLNVINIFEVALNILLRGAPRLLPKTILKLIYIRLRQMG
ncbi:MAG: glycosyltransferase [Alphaproteobacteria bacterium]